MIGKRFGKLVLTEKVKGGWKCICDCGNTSIVRQYRLLDGHTKSCGCLKFISPTKHGKTFTRTWQCWEAMRQRCLRQSHPRYPLYGGRGIGICQEWASFEQFYADMGDAPPKMSLGRIDNNKGYSKQNCRWETQNQQLNNTRRNVFLKFQGMRKTLAQWSEHLGLKRSTVNHRYAKGLSVEKILAPISRSSGEVARATEELNRAIIDL